MSGTTAGVSSAEAPQSQVVRERATLIGFVIVSVVATFAWLLLLGYLAVAGLRTLGL